MEVKEVDKNFLWTKEKSIERTIENLQKNNMEGYFVKDKKELISVLEKLISKGDKVSVGGSVTLVEADVLDFLRKGDFNFLDRYKFGLSKDEINDIYRQTFFADVFLTSSNAITENGELYNIDGNGNRVAAMIYGPKQVIVVIGMNKIVKNIDDAFSRVKQIACPSNAKRLNRNTPCAKVGYCTECSSDDRICSDYVIMKRQTVKGRIKVIIVEENLGY